MKYYFKSLIIDVVITIDTLKQDKKFIQSNLEIYDDFEKNNKKYIQKIKYARQRKLIADYYVIIGNF